MLEPDLTFYDKEALLYRLHEGLSDTNKDVVFVVGAPLTAPQGSERGVADVSAVVELIRSEFANKPTQLEKLDIALARSKNVYQSAFDFLSGRAGQDAANRIIKRAVSQALVPSATREWTDTAWRLPDDQLHILDKTTEAWQLNPAVSALGGLAARYPKRFGQIVLTSNFDPLIEVSIAREGGAAWRTCLSVDGSIFQSTAPGTQIIHIHGYWYGADTLHTSRQLVKNRPTLKNDLLALLQNKIVVVVAYGGWPDIFTGSLGGVVSNDNLFPEVLWTFYETQPCVNDHLYESLRPGIDRNRVSFYSGVNCHEFFPELLKLWDQVDTSSELPNVKTFSHDSATSPPRPDRARLFRLPPLECDRPPNVEIWVGRESELRALETSKAKVVIICGIGGEGKSVLASHYVTTLCQREYGYRYWDWRDCKEQSDRIRTQMIEIIVRFANRSITSDDLSETDDNDLVEVFIDQTFGAEAVIVLDNVDSYVDLENKTFTGILDKLVQRMAASDSASRIVLTCRPDVHYAASSAITFSLKGISAHEAVELFAKRAPGFTIPEDDIREAHSLTNGHAFWLDLLAVQVTKVPGTTLRKLLNDMRRGREGVPDVLSSIWGKLARREQILLRFMAEAMRPETELTIQKFSASQLNYKNFSRALRSLVSLNLIVVKIEVDAPDLYDLHPLVRQFVRNSFAQPERNSFIRVVIRQYEAIIGTIESLLGINLPFPMLERWSQKAELEVSAGLYEEAFETLAKVEDAFIGAGHLQEYIRVGRLLFEAIDWETAATKYKRFDGIVGIMVHALNQIGEWDAASSMMDRYEDTVPQKTARYIKLCDIRADSHWARGEFELAIGWAEKGVILKDETNVDTDFDCQHTLALAKRDNGEPELALDYFLGGRQIAEVVLGKGSPAGGPTYGNVGRCLQFMERADESLACYRTSIRMLEADSSACSKSNRAYARRWIGEILEAKGDSERAVAFYMDAIRILGNCAPGRVRDLFSQLRGVRGEMSIVMSEAKAEHIVKEWMSE